MTDPETPSDQLTPADMKRMLYPFRRQVEREIRRKLKIDEGSTYVTFDRELLAALMDNYDSRGRQLAAQGDELDRLRVDLDRLRVDNAKYRADYLQIGATVGRQRDIVAAAQPALEAANRVVRAWWELADTSRWLTKVDNPKLAEALDALAGVVRDEETT
jgi:hypothetical protein